MLLVGVLLAGLAYWTTGFLPFSESVSPYPARMGAAITALTAACWLGNGLSLGAASLIPLALMPTLGVLPIGVAAPSYAHPILWLFFGGFVLALGVQRWGLHRRIALAVLVRIGAQPARLIFGFMAAAALLSMWLSNTATALLLFPIAIALVRSLVDSRAVDVSSRENFSFALLLGIAYGCSVGGVATPIGTAPNALFLSTLESYGERGAPPISFLSWMVLALPVTLVLLPLIWIYLVRFASRLPRGHPEARSILEEKARELEPMSKAEWRMAALFVLVALLWMTRQDFDLGKLGTIPGWWRLMPVQEAADIGDGAVATFVALLAFLIPSGRKRGESLMNWDEAKKMPWEILYLLGGGILIARAFSETGLSEAIGLFIKPTVSDLHPLGMIVLVCVMVTFLTEVTSNTAVVALLLPVLASTAAASDVDPRLLMLPATFSASCAFMLPIATPPNAIVYASGEIPMARMARTGFALNLLGVVVIALVTWLVAVHVLGIDPYQSPEWARE